MYSVILRQCTEAMREKIEGDVRFTTIKNESDAIALLQLIHEIVYDAEAERYPFMAQYNALKTS